MTVPAKGSLSFTRWMTERRAQLRERVLVQLQTHKKLTASQLRVILDAGMRELDEVLQQMRRDGVIVTHRRWWSVAPCAG